MGGASLPPGFRFHPTDEELVGYYLKRKVEGLEIELEVIPVIDLYKFEPWELPEKSFLPMRDMEWFFFCPRDRKYPNGSRTNRATRSGYWKATGKDRKIVCQSSAVGYRKTLVFYRGRAPAGDRTDWVMHEYRLSDDASQDSSSSQGPFALCRVIKKNEQGIKKGDIYGDSNAKQVGCSSSNGMSMSNQASGELVVIPDDMPFQASPLNTPYRTPTMVESESFQVEANSSSLWLSPNFIFDSSTEYSQGQEGLSECFPQNEISNTMTAWDAYGQFEITPSSSYSNFTEKVDLADDLSQFGCMSPYSGQIDYATYFGMPPPEGYDWSNVLNPNSF